MAPPLPDDRDDAPALPFLLLLRFLPRFCPFSLARPCSWDEISLSDDELAVGALATTVPCSLRRAKRQAAHTSAMVAKTAIKTMAGTSVCPDELQLSSESLPSGLVLPEGQLSHLDRLPSSVENVFAGQIEQLEWRGGVSCRRALGRSKGTQTAS